MVGGKKYDHQKGNEVPKNVSPSPLSGGYSQQAFCSRGPVASRSRGRHPSRFTGYDHHQRGSYPSQNPQYPPSSYGNYPPSQAQRGSFGPSWEQRPPFAMHGPPQGNYNYGQPPNHEYGQLTAFHQAPMQSYGLGYNKMKYENQGPAQHPYVLPGRATQAYDSNVPTQQSYPYASGGTVQQSYPPYGSAPPTHGYSHPQPASATAPVYPQHGGPPFSGYGQTGVQLQPSAYSTGRSTTSYNSYPAQPGYGEQPVVANSGYSYEASAGPSYSGAATTIYGGAVPNTPQSGYVHPAPTQFGYDQSNA